MSATIAQLVSKIEERAGLPANRDRFVTADLIDLMKEELQETVLPFMYSLVEEFFVVGKLQPMQTFRTAYTITPTVANLTLYTVTLNGVLFSYTSDASATAAEIVAGLLAAINADVEFITATGTTTLILTADSVDQLFTIATSSNLTYLSTGTSGNKFPDLLIPIPKRAFARGVRDLQFINSGSVRSNIPQIAPEDIDLFLTNSLANFTTPAGFYFKNDNIALVGTDVAITGDLDITFYLRVPTLTSDTTQQAPVTNIQWNATTGKTDITATTSSSAASFLSGTGIFDLYRWTTGAYSRVDLVCTISGSGSTRTFSTSSLTEDLMTTLASGQSGGMPVAAPYSGEYILVPQDTIPYSPIPDELDNFLVSAICGRVLEALGDTEGLSTNMAVMKKIQDNMSKIYGDRAVGATKKAVYRRGVYNFMRRRFIKGRI